ncbi:MAG TPA: pyridoxamine 5'-phosphate oxidase family protein [Candidatus Sulfotelmatobacter sp.]|nr:pyridoxamine 5'-phosphate oxidase family protein [Candidatus Sulfotelmatobacter sp.]
MTDTECGVFLASASLGRLGCSLGDQPYVVPINFAYEPGYIYVLSTFGRKIEWMRANPKVCVEVEELANESQWRSVLAFGRYQELPEPQYAAEREHARKLLEKRYRWWLNALGERQLRVGDDLIPPLFFRICIDSITGLRAMDEIAESGKAPKK